MNVSFPVKRDKVYHLNGKCQKRKITRKGKSQRWLQIRLFKEHYWHKSERNNEVTRTHTKTYRNTETIYKWDYTIKEIFVERKYFLELILLENGEQEVINHLSSKNAPSADEIPVIVDTAEGKGRGGEGIEMLNKSAACDSVSLMTF